MKIVNQNVELIDHMGSDLSVVNAARVSFAKESEWDQSGIQQVGMGEWVGEEKLLEKDVKLISYLAKHNHWSPFAHAFLSFRIKSPIFVARQLVKHQVGLSWNEVSRRYVDDEPEFWYPKLDEWRGKPVNAKQGSQGFVDFGATWNDYNVTYCHTPESLGAQCLKTYQYLIGRGVAPEQARMVLPQNMMTEWLWSGSLAAFARVCKLRLDPHAQAETREIAEKIRDQIPKEFEHSWTALTT